MVKLDCSIGYIYVDHLSRVSSQHLWFLFITVIYFFLTIRLQQFLTQDMLLSDGVKAKPTHPEIFKLCVYILGTVHCLKLWGRRGAHVYVETGKQVNVSIRILLACSAFPTLPHSTPGGPVCRACYLCYTKRCFWQESSLKLLKHL